MEKRNEKQDKRAAELRLIREMLLLRISKAASNASYSLDEDICMQHKLGTDKVLGLAAQLKDVQTELAEMTWAKPEGICT